MTRPRWRRPALLSAGLLLLIAASPALAQPKQPFAAFLEGTEVFRRILFERNFTALHSFDDLAKDPEQTILIVFGDARRIVEVPGELNRFVKRGGALFLATDRRLPRAAEDALIDTAGVRIAGQSVICKNKQSCYRDLEVCPFLKPIEGADPNLFRNLVEGDSSLSRVASNAPSFLEPDDDNSGVPFLSQLAFLPEDSALESKARLLNSTPLFAVGGDRGRGRVLVLADHSIFINEMMLPEDNGNVEFTYNCLEWLRGDPVPGRNQVLFVEDGIINSHFEVPLKEMPDELMKRIIEYLGQHPDEAAKLALSIAAHYPKETAKLALDVADAADKTAQKVTPEVERSLQEVDERDGINDHLLQGFADPDALLRGLLVWLAVLVVLYGCYKIGWKARRRSDLEGPLLSAALYKLAPADTVGEQRRRDLIRGDNLWEPAHELARQCLPESALPPNVVVQGGWLLRRTMTGRVRRLWRLAYGSPTRVSLNQWRRLLRESRQVKTAVANGVITFSPLSPVLRGEGRKMGGFPQHGFIARRRWFVNQVRQLAHELRPILNRMAGDRDDRVSLAHRFLVGWIEELAIEVIDRPGEHTADADFRHRNHIGQDAESVHAHKDSGDYDQ